jgi:uncharacterized membrane protein YdjX (TVP38/TMEM64 family)
MSSTHRLLIALAAIVLLIVTIAPIRTTLAVGFSLLASGQLAQFGEFLRSLGLFAPIASITLMTLEAVAVPLPVAIIMVANGLAFGFWPGVLVSLIGGLVGAVLAYLIGRFLGRSVLEKLIPQGSVRMADKLMARYGPWAILVERLIPGIPGDPASYVAGVTRMRPVYFVALTLAGLLPSNIVTAYLGAEVAGDVPREYWIAGVVLVAGGCVVWWSLRRGRTLERQERGRMAATNGARLVTGEESSAAPPPSG